MLFGLDVAVVAIARVRDVWWWGGADDCGLPLGNHAITCCTCVPAQLRTKLHCVQVRWQKRETKSERVDSSI
jgi:hypothetical protein